MLLHSSNLLSARDGLQALFRRRKLILLVFMMTVIPVGVVTFTASKVYRATTKVLVRREDRPGALNPYFSRLNQEEDIRSELEIAVSRPVLGALLRLSLEQGQMLDDSDSTLYHIWAAYENSDGTELGSIRQTSSLVIADGQQPLSLFAEENEALVEKTLDLLRRRIAVEAVTGANVIALSFDDTNPPRAAWYANALAKAYAAYNAEVHSGKKAENFLTERIDETRTRLDSLEKALYAYRASTGLVVDHKQEDLMYEKYRAVDSQLAQLRERAEVLTEKVTRLRQVRAAGDSLAIPTAEMDAHPSVRQLYSKLTELRLQRNVMAEKYKSDHRLMSDLAKQIHGVQGELVSEVERLLALEDERLRSLQQEEKVLAKMVVNAKDAIQSLPEKKRVLDELELAIDNARKIYSLQVLRREEMSVDKATDSRLSRITMISPAGVPFEPVSPRPGRNMLLGLVLGALAGLAAGLVREFFDGTFKSPDEVAKSLGVPVLGTISAKTKKKKKAKLP
jgi:uncharacterized protein involved in exopolysaccharide biosynthesis